MPHIIALILEIFGGIVFLVICAACIIALMIQRDVDNGNNPFE